MRRMVQRPHVVVIGGGFAGCAAAVAARTSGVQVTLLERTNLLLGSGLVGGIIKNNGRLTAWEELRYLGAHGFLQVIESCLLHCNIDFPGHRHASLYDVDSIEPEVRTYLKEIGVELRLESRVVDAIVAGRRVVSVVLEDGEIIEGEAFIEATGSAGPMGNCLRHGAGCVMCIFRCPAFGGRVSISAKAGVQDIIGDFSGMSGSCEIPKENLGRWLVDRLESNGYLVIPIPKYIAHGDVLDVKACQQYALPEYAHNLILLDTGKVKVMTPYFPLELIRQLPGFQRVKYADPYAGGRGNSVRLSVITPHELTLRVTGLENLYAAGEKLGPLVGHTEALVTGFLAGHNGARTALDLPPIVLPEELACGDFVKESQQTVLKENPGKVRFTFSGSTYFARMQELGLYTTHLGEIEARVNRTGLTGIFAKRLL